MTIKDLEEKLNFWKVILFLLIYEEYFFNHINFFHLFSTFILRQNLKAAKKKVIKWPKN